jgi:hypothetical protein
MHRTPHCCYSASHTHTEVPNMRRFLTTCCLLAMLCPLAATAGVSGGSPHSIGYGAHYWRTIEDIAEEGFKSDGVGYFLSYQYRPSAIVRLGVDMEAMPEQFAGAAENIYLPQAYILFGSDLYAGIGFGSYFYDWSLSGNAFYFLRAGIVFDLLAQLKVDLFTQYRFENWERIEEVDEDLSTDTITLSGALRLVF